jgi:hypothetical protein
MMYFGLDEMIFTTVLICMTAIGTYAIVKEKYLKVGIEVGTELAINSLIADGYLATKIDSDGDESLLTIKEVKASVIR